MEFSKKLQELRKSRGITQEELAASIFVSRTAVSKWESGRGYPSIDSLKAVSEYFAVSIDELLSGEELLFAARDEKMRFGERARDLVFGLADVIMALLLFLPLFADRRGAEIMSVSLISPLWDGYTRFVFLALAVTNVILGIVILAMQGCGNILWNRLKCKLSFAFSIVLTLVFIISLQPYAALLTIALLSLKVVSFIHRP